VLARNSRAMHFIPNALVDLAASLEIQSFQRTCEHN